jgi:hypothetical protein
MIASTRSVQPQMIDALESRSYHFLPSSNHLHRKGRHAYRSPWNGWPRRDETGGCAAAARRRRTEGRVQRGLVRVYEPSKHLQIEDFDARTTPAHHKAFRAGAAQTSPERRRFSVGSSALIHRDNTYGRDGSARNAQRMIVMASIGQARAPCSACDSRSRGTSELLITQ